MDKTLKPWILTLCLIAVVSGLWLYIPWNLYFLNDDFIHIPLSRDWVLFQRKSFRPLCDISIALDYWLYKTNATGYHVTNVLLHAANTLLVYFFSKNLFEKYALEKIWIAPIVAVLFFIYPFHSESIYWVLGRSASLGSLCCLASLLCYLKRNGSIKAFALSVFFFSAGLLTYESVWVLPIFCVCISFLDIRQKSTTLQPEIKWLLVISFVFITSLALRWFTIGEIAGNYEAESFKVPDVSAIVQNFIRLFTRSFLPPTYHVAGMYLCVGFSVVIFVWFSIKIIADKSLFMLMLFVCFVVSLFPYLSLGIDMHGVEGERYLYLPSIFATLLIGVSLAQLVRHKRLFIFLLFGIFSYSVIYLCTSCQQYKIAGNITLKTIEAVNQLQGKQRMRVDSLPQENNGALIFRLGFMEGVNWLKSPGTVEEVQVNSVKQMDAQWSKNFKILNAGRPARENAYPPDEAHFLFTGDDLIITK